MTRSPVFQLVLIKRENKRICQLTNKRKQKLKTRVLARKDSDTNKSVGVFTLSFTY